MRLLDWLSVGVFAGLVDGRDSTRPLERVLGFLCAHPYICSSSNTRVVHFRTGCHGAEGLFVPISWDFVVKGRFKVCQFCVAAEGRGGSGSGSHKRTHRAHCAPLSDTTRRAIYNLYHDPENLGANAKSIRQIARDYHISSTVVHNVIRQAALFGTPDRPVVERRKRPRLLSSQQVDTVLDWLSDDPWLSNDAIAKRAQAEFGLVTTPSRSLISRELKRAGCRFSVVKERREIAFSPDVMEERKAWVNEFGVAPAASNIVFVDESGFYVHSRLKRARGRRGAHINSKVPNNAGDKMNVIGAMSGKRTIFAKTHIGNVDGARFVHFLTELSSLIDSQADWFEAGQIWIVMDNCSIHGTRDVLDFFARHPRLVPRYLPRYSPFLNIIELLWNWLKASIRKNRPNTRPELERLFSALFCSTFAPRLPKLVFIK